MFRALLLLALADDRRHAEAQQVAALVRQATDVETALRLLARHQARLPTRGRWARSLAAPAFDEVPLAGGGLWRHEVDGVVVWVGPAAAVGLALGRARARGLVLQVDQGNGGARVYRVGASELELVATLIVDESAATRATIDLPPPKRASHVPGALTLVAGGVCYHSGIVPTLGLALCGLAVVLWLVTQARRSVHLRTRVRPPRRRATLTLAVNTASPYRGAAAEPVPVERLFAWFREAGVPIAARHGDAFVAAGDGAECRIDGGGVGSVRLAELVVSYDDAAGPATVARVLAAHVGAVQVALADGTFTIADAGDFERWMIDHRRRRAALADLADALEAADRAG